MNIRVGFIGLGVMGKPMALNLIKDGYPLRVFSRRAESMAPLVAAGAVACSTPAETARAADMTLIMVSGMDAVEEVILGPQGILAGAKPGTTVVVTSTISPEAARSLAGKLSDRGVEMLDAPVSGGESEAIDGSLSIMAGGKEETFALARPIFERLGKNIVHVGPSGAGQLAKACNQIAVTMALEGVAEAFSLARKSGVDPARVREALLGGFAGSKTLEVRGKKMLDADFRPGFKARHHQKDLRTILEIAHRMGFALPGTAVATQHINALVGGGEGEADLAALINVIERLNGKPSKENG